AQEKRGMRDRGTTVGFGSRAIHLAPRAQGCWGRTPMGKIRFNRSPESPFRKEDFMRRHVLSIALVLLSLASTPASAAAVATSNPSQLVTVAAVGNCTAALGLSTDLFNTLVKGDGTTAPFSIPAGQVLVITDLTVFAPGKTAGGTVQVQVVVGTATSHFS